MKRAFAASALLMLLAPRWGAAQPLPAAADPNEPLSVLTYNVHGLPWPIVEERSDELAAIGAKLAELRKHGAQPSVVLLQEAFTDSAAQIGREAGYRYSANGPMPDEHDPVAMQPSDRVLAAAANPLKGETEGKWESSGLRIFSDFPIVAISRMAYPSFACAGFDCLANKGVLLVTLSVPGRGLVQVATTHLNSRAASGVPDARSIVAYRRQVDVLDHFIRRHADPALPLIVAGDFNVGDAPGRRPALLERAESWKTLEGGVGGEGLRACVADGQVDHLRDASEIIRRSRDFQFFYSGKRATLTAESANIPFGRGPNGSMLSDHIGFSITYKIAG
ncbi:endonuclease/exonuclease/phosphatase family protein [Sphingomonas tabacisoli]|uniref:Endonuclease/exonuclease/phosphatase family protein n=1 Tax=Sphingomonas tabacisoli TaxID=2249466 RepID=A0ABW4I230_9SPHN